MMIEHEHSRPRHASVSLRLSLALAALLQAACADEGAAEGPRRAQTSSATPDITELNDPSRVNDPVRTGASSDLPPVVALPDTSAPETPVTPESSAEPSTASPETGENINTIPTPLPTADPTLPEGSVFGPVAGSATESAVFYSADGYSIADVLSVDVLTRPEGQGPCSEDGTAGCTLADVIADIDGSDDFVAEVPIRFRAADFQAVLPDANAELRQRGNTSRTAPQKSFRIKLDAQAARWRNERRLQLNKHPFDRSRLRNKLAFDLMQRVPHLPSLRTQFVQLNIDNGDGPLDMGLYTHVEAVQKEYLLNRGHNADDALYKAESFQFLASELDELAIDAAGEPLDAARFESRLEIKRGEDHRPLLRAVSDVADTGIPFSRTLERHFDADNALAWIVTNLLLGQQDAGSHNYYLHDPLDSTALYFLPWDYDNAFISEYPLTESFDPVALRVRLTHGFARLHDNRFTRRWLEQPGAYEKLVAAAGELRAEALSDDAIDALIAAYAPLIRPLIASMPDIEFVAGVREPANMAAWDAEIASIADIVEANYRALVDGPHVPLPPFIKQPSRRDGALVLSWEPALSVSGGTVVYDIEIASQADIDAGSVVFSASDIADAPGRVEYPIEPAMLPPGDWYLRVVARVVGADPGYWQIANNTLVGLDGHTHIGVRAFTVLP